MECLKRPSLGAMAFVLTKLDELLQTEERAKPLIGDLRVMCSKMEKLSEVHDPPLMVKYWMNDARELSYDMEISVDQFVHASQPDALSAKVPWIKEILGFTARVQEVIERCDRYNLVNKYACSTLTTIAVSHNLQTVNKEPELVNLFGMEEETNKLLEWMKLKDPGEDDLKLKVTSILGDEGVGKSALVKRLWYASEGKFDFRAFVQTAKKSDTRMILRSILSQVRPKQPPKACKVPRLIEDLREHLQDKRYFIVIDGLWDVSVWHIVRRAFPDGNYRIITTTAVEKVAQACCSYDRNNVVSVKHLDEDQSKELFVDKAFGSEKGCPQQVSDVIDEITRKCDGLPLAIICAARLIASQPETEQEKQLDYVNKFLPIHLGTNTASMEILNQVLKLCYCSLPPCLKSCLLYLSIYPENYSILKEDVVRQWIAEDFICTQEGRDIVDVASSYFDELLNLGLIQRMDSINYNKKGSVSYTVHPAVFDFITCKSMEDNFLTIIDYSQSTVVVTEKIRRLSLHFGSATYATIPKSVELSKVRSLAFTGLLGCLPSFVEFQLVRVMILHLQSDDGNTRFSLAEISNLILLRYLQVRSNVTVELPKQLGCLKHLETIEINAQVATVTSDVVRHPSLLRVRLGTVTKHKHHTLGSFTSGKAIFPDVLSCSPSASIEVLKLLPPVCSFSRLPGWIQQLRGLRILEVVITELWAHDINHLAKLPVLAALSVYVLKPAAGCVVTFHRGAFPVLRYLKLVSRELLLNFFEGALPNLRRLKIGFNAQRWEKYSRILGGIQHLLNLKDIAASIGAEPDAKESDKRAAESELIVAIRTHPHRPSFKVKLVDRVEEQYDACASDVQNLSQQQESSSHESYEVQQKQHEMQDKDSCTTQSKLDGAPDARITDYFDVIAGVSTGALLTSMLATPDEINNRKKYADICSPSDAVEVLKLSPPIRSSSVMDTSSRALRQPLPSTGKLVTILSIDCIGIHCLVPAIIIAFLEERLQEIDDAPDARIADYFDVIAGTSTGALLTSMLATPDENNRPRFTAKDIVTFFLDKGPMIFPEKKSGFLTFVDKLLDMVRGPKNNGGFLHDTIKRLTNDVRIADTVTNIIITAFDVKKRQPVIFSSYHAKADPLKNVQLSDICIGTLVEPTHSPQLSFLTNDGKGGSASDGTANNPTMVPMSMLTKEVLRHNPDFNAREPADCSNCLIISIGTGSAKKAEKYTAPQYDALFEALHRERNFLHIQDDSLAGDTSSTMENMQTLISIGEELMMKPVSRVNINTGLYKPVRGGRTNQEELLRFAHMLSDERRLRLIELNSNRSQFTASSVLAI